MSYPDFFDAVARITLYDPLAELLGAADRGGSNTAMSMQSNLPGIPAPRWQAPT